MRNGAMKDRGPVEEAELVQAYEQALSDLSTARDQLAEMREALTESVAAVEALLMDAPTTMLERVDYQNIIDNAKRTLSAAPAGGRVLSRFEMQEAGSTFDYQYFESIDDSISATMSVCGKSIVDMDEQVVIVTVTEAPPSADEE